MKRRATLIIVLAIVSTALVVSERRRVDAPVSPAPIVYFIADAQRELSSLPVRATRLPDAEEIAIGERIASRYRPARAGPTQDPDVAVVSAYVERIGRVVAAGAHRKLPYKFFYIPETTFVNAFALPGGAIFVGGGLIGLMRTEDELAAVLGHEIEHVDHYHCAERVQLQARLRKVPIVGAVGQVLAIPVELFQAGYTKAQELEADREGTRLAARAGYSPGGAVTLFETMDRLHREAVARHPRRPSATPQAEAARVAAQTIEGYFQSHPPADERIAQIRDVIRTDALAEVPRRSLAVAYVLLTERARDTLGAREYDETIALAEQSLALKPDQPKALDVLAQAHFARVEFAQAADVSRRLLDTLAALDYPPPVSAVRAAHAYADALAAAGSGEDGARAFETWLTASARLAPLYQIRVDLAGLQLLAGDARGMGAALERARTRADDSWPPEATGRLGSWYYRTGQYALAAELLGRAVQQRPNDRELHTELAWALLELRNHEDALRRFDSGISRPEPWHLAEDVAGRAVASWRSGNREAALDAFARMESLRSPWLNERLITTVYSQIVARSITELRAERQVQLRAQRARRASIR